MTNLLKIKQAGLTAEIYAARRIERKLKKMRNRKVRVVPDPFASATVVSIIPGTNPDGYKAWGNEQLLRVQYNRRLTSRQARRLHLANMFLRGTPYHVAEQTTKKPLTKADWKWIESFALEFSKFRKLSDQKTPLKSFEFLSEQQFQQRFEQWKQGF